MKKVVFIFLFVILFIAGKTQTIEGKWKGTLNIQGRDFIFVMNLVKTAEGYQSNFDTPEQNAFGILASSTIVRNDSIISNIATMGAKLKVKWNGQDDITGGLVQQSINMPVTLHRTGEKPVLVIKNRPQTPKPPYNYHTEDIEYDNAGKTVHYAATLSTPKNKSNFPTVIIISGSGQQDRDGTIFDHKIYAVLADYLTNQGIGVLRVDDRGIGKSSTDKPLTAVTSLDFETDVEASLNYLLSRKDIDKKKIGLIGHSEGGAIAPMVAARRKEIAFLVLWGAPAVGGAEINTEQNAALLKNSGFSPSALTAFKDLHKKELLLFATTPKEAIDEKINAVFSDWQKQQSAETLTALVANGHTILGRDVLTFYHGLYDNSWMRFFIAYDPAVDLAKVACPVLAINGTKDTQVNADTNLPLIYSILTKNGNRQVQVTPLGSLNHLLQTASTGELAEYDKIEETISPVALSLISNWIKNLVL